MTTPSFDLVTRPWIRVRLHTGECTELSLNDTFARAHETARLVGDLPTQDFAMLRLLLAVLRRSHPDARTTEDWRELWERGSFDLEPLRVHLDQHRERFDLLHPVTPFFQVAGLATAKGAMTEVARLVADVPAGHQFFAMRAGAALESLSFAEAARWLVHCQAFDPSGIKSGALGDDRVKGGKGYPIGTAWCGRLGGVVIEGRSLFETLLLNLPLEPVDPATLDTAVWERQPQSAAVEARPGPGGPADLLTWQSRRLRLGYDGCRVTGVLIANGDRLHPANRFRHEHMTSWRLSQAQMKAQGTTEMIFMPREHQAGRSLWRGLSGLIAESADAASAATSKPGRWLDWLANLREDEVLPPDLPVRVRAIAMHYGPQDSTTADITDDSLPLQVGILVDEVLRALALDAVRDADAAVRALAGLAGDLAEAAGAETAPSRSAAFERGYAVLDAPYRRWVAQLGTSSERDVERPRWQQTVRGTLFKLAVELVRSAGQGAWTGREVGRGDKSIYLDAAIAENAFRRRLRTALPLAYPSPEKESTHDE